MLHDDNDDDIKKISMIQVYDEIWFAGTNCYLPFTATIIKMMMMMTMMRMMMMMTMTMTSSRSILRINQRTRQPGDPEKQKQTVP